LSKETSATSGVILIGAVLTMLVAINAVNTDTLAPGIPALRDYFGVSTSKANLVFSAYVLAFGVMQLVYGPLSDRFGRRPVLLSAMSVYCFSTLLCAIAPTFETLLLARALQGASASAAPALARAIIRDLYGVNGSRKVMSYVMSAFGIMAIVAPAMLLPAEGHIDFSFDNAYLWAGLASFVIAWRWKNLLLTIVAGMGVFLLWRLVG